MISHHHQCIFVHIPKAAGQSIERVFLDDIGLTWNTRAPLLLRKNKNPMLGPPLLAHMTAQDYLTYKYVPPEMFRRYYKFAVVRNPWSRTVSAFRYLETHRHFEDFVEKLTTDREFEWFLKPQTEFLDVDGQNVMDDVLRLETLADEFSRVRDRLGLTSDLQHVNKTGSRKGAGKRFRNRLKKTNGRPWRAFGPVERHEHWRDYYSADTEAAVANYYAEDIRAFGYRFSDEPHPA